MSFNKRYVRKEMILNKIDDVSYIFRLFNSDILIMDDWSNNFLKNFNYNFESFDKVRKQLIDGVDYNDNYKKLFNLSNIFINLKTDPTLVDVKLTYDSLNKEIPNIELCELIESSIKLIDDYYSKK